MTLLKLTQTGLLPALILCITPRLASAVDFHPTIDAARADEAAQTEEAKKPAVVTFTGEWCAWCRKMDVDTFQSEAVAALAGRFLWVKIDVDQQEELAAQFHVRGLPNTFVLNEEDRIIATRPGYMPADVFVEFLRDALENPQPVEDVLGDLLEALASGPTPDDTAAAIAALTEYVARARRADRSEALAALEAAGEPVWSLLAMQLSDERLAVRAAAGGVLSHVTRAEIAFDPFSPPDERAEQIAAWQAWIETETAEVDSKEEE
ncbi:MAG: thioredoxin [Planctomycetota bacterium]|nr:MAG: thioredoxin [Planctomycetota bacterium]REK22130.1 MAG: thioredoxin [Planctomycetota bacterium]REK34942.1 MAG: thioredoxin [Planctomycetota bacterium]